VFQGRRRTRERVLHEGWVDERCSRGNRHGEHTPSYFIYPLFICLLYPPVHRRMSRATLVAALVAQLGTRQANLELKWMRQHPHHDMSDMLRRRTLGEPLQYILGSWYPPLLSRPSHRFRQAPSHLAPSRSASAHRFSSLVQKQSIGLSVSQTTSDPQRPRPLQNP